MEIFVFGAGYVGLVQAAGLASTGNHVYLADISEKRIKDLRDGNCPIHEPGLPELLNRGISTKFLNFCVVGSTEYKKHLKDAEILFIAVQTPESADGSPNLEYVYSVVDAICSLEGNLKDKIVVTKSTVPVGTGDLIEERFKKNGKYPVVTSNPEFLKQGNAVQDFLKAERMIVGTNDARARKILGFLYQPLMLKQNRVINMSRRSAELVKYACNSFLATKISFINEIAELCEIVGADIRDIRQGMVSDSRIGDQFLFPGLGYGGSCFPKDTVGLIFQGNRTGLKLPIVEAVDQINKRQRHWAFDKLKQSLGSLKDKTITLWGLSFKPNTDDLREAPSIYLINQLLSEGAIVQATDPIATENAKEKLKDALKTNRLKLIDETYAAAEGADALVLTTEWHEYRSPNFVQLSKMMKQRIIVDGRNIYSPEITNEYGFQYFGVGIPTEVESI